MFTAYCDLEVQYILPTSFYFTNLLEQLICFDWFISQKMKWNHKLGRNVTTIVAHFLTSLNYR